MARFRSKSCPDVITRSSREPVKCAIPLQESGKLPEVRTDTAAGKCGVKDQVSTRSPLNSLVDR